MTNKEIKDFLHLHADEGYRRFTQKLITNIPPDTILGVRLPIIKKLAKEIYKGSDWRTYLAEASDDTFEEKMLQGFVIGSIETLELAIPYIERFIGKIDNWSVCDSFCGSLKIVRRYPDTFWSFVKPLLYDRRDYYIRFALVITLRYFADSEHCSEAFNAFSSIKNDGYYVKMALAWAVAEFYAKLPNETLEFLKENSLSRWTHNKAIQKIKESRLTGKETHEMLNSLKR